MQAIGCTLINKPHGESCDLTLNYKVGTEIGRWDRLKRPVRPPGPYASGMNFGESGELVQSLDKVGGDDKSFMSIYDAGSVSGMKNKSLTPPIVHIFCGSWDTVIERVACGNFVSGKAFLYRSKLWIEFELWMACS